MQDEDKQPEIKVSDIDDAPSSIPSSRGDVSVSVDDYVRALARVTAENEDLKEQINKLKSKIRTTEILDELIEPFAKKAYLFMCAYSGFVGISLLMNAFGCFKLPIQDSVMHFLVGSTAVTVIGLVGMVLTGIFIGARRNSD